jgi:2'-5' RNA ligase
MPFYIALAFDLQSTTAIYPYWEKLLEYDSEIFEKNFPPHISLFLCKQLDVTAVMEKIKMIANRFEQFELKFVDVARFQKPGDVIYLKPDDNHTLRELYLTVHRELSANCQGINELYLPERWIPHSTIGIKIFPEVIDEAFDAARQQFNPFSVFIESIYLAEYDPKAKEKWRYMAILKEMALEI